MTYSRVVSVNELPAREPHPTFTPRDTVLSSKVPHQEVRKLRGNSTRCEKGKTTTSSLTVRHFPTLIGRHRECNLRIAARQVSRRHCVLKNRDGWLVVCDLESCNGTHVNGRPIRGDQVLRPGDQLEIGPIIFEITYAAPVDDVQQVDASETQILASSTTLRTCKCRASKTWNSRIGSRKSIV